MNTVKNGLLPVIFFCIFALSVSCPIDRENSVPKYEFNEEKTCLNAVRGDPIEALRMSHRCFDSGRYDEMLFWLTIAAENDHCYSQDELSYLLRVWDFYNYPELNKEEKYIRSIYWLYNMGTAEYTFNPWPETAVKGLKREGYTLETAKPPDDSLFDYDYASLSETEIAACREGALQGSGKAALVIARYYGEIEKKTDSEVHWYQIGAQNGNVECMRQFGNILSGKDRYLDQERGKFWLDRANQYIHKEEI